MITDMEKTIIRNALILFTEMIYDLRIEINELKGTLTEESRNYLEGCKETQIVLMDKSLFLPPPPGAVDPLLNE